MSTIIKAGQIPSPLGRARRIELTDHLNEAKARLEEARRQAGALVAHARETAGAVHAEVARTAFEEGYLKGYSAGQRAGRQKAFDEAITRFEREHRHLAQALQEATTRVDELKEDLLIQAKRDVLELAVAIGEKVTKRIGTLDRAAAQANAEAAIDLLSPQTDLTLRVHPADAETMRRFASELVDHLAAVQHVHIVEDATQEPGGCMAQSGDRQVDARIGVQVEQIVELLLGRPETTSS